MSASDRLKSALEAFWNRLAGKYDYFAHYPCTVVSQNPDGSLELKPDSPLWPGLSNIPIRYGVPGVTVQVASGARVMLFFENGSPQAPRAAIWESSGLNQITITAATAVVVNGGDCTVNGQNVQVNATKNVGVQASGDCNVQASGNCSVKASGTCSVDGAIVSLGGGGPPVARVGDVVFIPSTAGAGAPSTGIIQKGSAKVMSG